MKFYFFILCAVFFTLNIHAQEIKIDGRLQPHLTEFFKICDQYNVPYHKKFSQLKSIDVVNNLPIEENKSVLGRVRRDDAGNVVAIDINYIVQLDAEILKVVAYHEFAHYFLEYSGHVCGDCGKIMSAVNSSYFEVVKNWEYELQRMFIESPAYKNRIEANLSLINYQ